MDNIMNIETFTSKMPEREEEEGKEERRKKVMLYLGIFLDKICLITENIKDVIKSQICTGSFILLEEQVASTKTIAPASGIYHCPITNQKPISFFPQALLTK